jgi:hypothetical protein
MELQNVDGLVYLLVVGFLGSVGLLMRNTSYIKAGVRRVPCIDALDEAVRICAETARPFYCANLGRPGDLKGLSELHCVEYVARQCGEVGVKVLTGAYAADENVALMDAVRHGYTVAGHPELFQIEDHKYYLNMLFSIPAHVNMIKSENAGAAMVNCWPPNPMLEAGYRIGAYTIAWAHNPDQTADHLVIANSAIFAEEGVAAGAYISKDPNETAHLISGDIAKIFLVFLIIGLLAYFATGGTL